MDNYDEFLQTLSFDPEGLSRQFMSLSAFINIVIASVVGFMVLAVYLASSSRAQRDRNLYMVIPVLSVLMAVVMRVDGQQAFSFIGILGILSIIRFRSDITDQKGITFILFAVIEGVIVGVNAYILALLAWVVVSGAILVGRYLLSRRTSYRLVLRASLPPEGAGEAGPALAGSARAAASSWFEARGIAAAFTGLSVSSEYSGKKGEWEEGEKLEFMLFPKDEEQLIRLLPAFNAEMRGLGIESELRRQEAR